MSSKKAARAAKTAKRSSKLVDAAQVGDVETMARVMSSGPKLDLDVLVARDGWRYWGKKEKVQDARVTALYAAAAGLKTSRRYGLTGTPVQNSMNELYSLLDLMTPGCMGEKKSFTVRCHNIAAVWVAFFLRCQQYGC